MDLDKLLTFAAKVGWPVMITILALWRLDWFLQRVVESQDKIAVLLQRLIELH